MAIRRDAYPADWPAISRRIRHERAGDHCEWCGAANHDPHPVTGSRVVLTVAHLPAAAGTMDCRDEVLAALCQRCHLRLDLAAHVRKAAETRRRKREQAGQLPLAALPSA